MSEVTPTAVETIETATDKAIDAVTDTVEASAKLVEAVVKPVPVATKAVAPAKKSVVKAAAKPVAAKSAVKRPAKRGPKPRATAPAVAAKPKVNRKAATAVAKRKYVRKAVASVKPSVSRVSPTLSTSTPNPFLKGIKTMDTTSFFAPFASVPGADKFQSLFAGAGEKSQEVVKKGQAFAEQFSETTRANLEAVVESSRIAAAGARDLGQELVASTKGGVEQATAAVKTLAEAKSPTEFFQLQSELVRASFDRMVAEGSKLTEQMVKLAGEAAQPLSSRASVNAEKFSELTA